MMRFKKDYNFKILSILVTIVFFLNSMAYGMDLSAKSDLRAPMMGNSHEGKARLENLEFLTAEGSVDKLVQSSKAEILSQYNFSVVSGSEFNVYINYDCPVVVKEVKLYAIAKESQQEFRQGLLRKFKVLRSVRLFLNRHFPRLRVFLDRTLRTSVENALKLRSIIGIGIKSESANRRQERYAGLNGYLIAKRKRVPTVPFIILDQGVVISAEGNERIIKNPLVQERINRNELINHVFSLYVAEGRLENAIVLLNQCMDLFEQLMRKGVFNEDVSVLDNMVLREGDVVFIDVGTLTEDKDVALDLVQSPNWIESINEAGRRLAMIHPKLGEIYLKRANELYSTDTIQAIWGDLHGYTGKFMPSVETRKYL